MRNLRFDVTGRTVLVAGAARGVGYAAGIPMGRFADASEMAAAVAFPASDESSYLTGVVLAVDGGMSL